MNKKSFILKTFLVFGLLSVPALSFAVSCKKSTPLSPMQIEINNLKSKITDSYNKITDEANKKTGINKEQIKRIINDKISKTFDYRTGVETNYLRLAAANKPSDINTSLLNMSNKTYEALLKDQITSLYQTSSYVFDQGFDKSLYDLFKDIILSNLKIAKTYLNEAINKVQNPTSVQKGYIESIKVIINKIGIGEENINISKLIDNVFGEYKSEKTDDSLFHNIIYKTWSAKTLGRLHFSIGVAQTEEIYELNASDSANLKLYFKGQSVSESVSEFVRNISISIFNETNKDENKKFSWSEINDRDNLGKLVYKGEGEIGAFLSESPDSNATTPIYAPVILKNFIDELTEIERKYHKDEDANKILGKLPSLSALAKEDKEKIAAKYINEIAEYELMKKTQDDKYVYVGLKDNETVKNTKMTEAFEGIKVFMSDLQKKVDYTEVKKDLGINKIYTYSDVNEFKVAFNDKLKNLYVPHFTNLNNVSKIEEIPKNAFGEYELVEYDPTNILIEENKSFKAKLKDGNFVKYGIENSINEDLSNHLKSIGEGLGLGEEKTNVSSILPFIPFIEYILWICRLYLISVTDIDVAIKDAYLFIKHVIVGGLFNVQSIIETKA